jgi:hypothetical protein
MPNVLTKGSTITCAHKGTVTPVAIAVTAVLQVAGSSVLVGTLVGSTVGADCIQKPPPDRNVPCTSILGQSAGTSTVLFVGANAVLLEGAKGTTNGSPNNDWSASDAAQSLLTAD